jgi:hypothetical protein
MKRYPTPTDILQTKVFFSACGDTAAPEISFTPTT